MESNWFVEFKLEFLVGEFFGSQIEKQFDDLTKKLGYTSELFVSEESGNIEAIVRGNKGDDVDIQSEVEEFKKLEGVKFVEFTNGSEWQWEDIG